MKPLEVKTKSEKHPSRGCLSNLSVIEETFAYSNQDGGESQTFYDTASTTHERVRE